MPDVTIGVDQGSAEGDATVVAVVVDGLVHAVTLPDQFGQVANIEERNGKIVVTSETGDNMIVPIPQNR